MNDVGHSRRDHGVVGPNRREAIGCHRNRHGIVARVDSVPPPKVDIPCLAPIIYYTWVINIACCVESEREGLMVKKKTRISEKEVLSLEYNIQFHINEVLPLQDPPLFGSIRARRLS